MIHFWWGYEGNIKMAYSEWYWYISPLKTSSKMAHFKRKFNWAILEMSPVAAILGYFEHKFFPRIMILIWFLVIFTFSDLSDFLYCIFDKIETIWVIRFSSNFFGSVLKKDLFFIPHLELFYNAVIGSLQTDLRRVHLAVKKIGTYPSLNEPT